MHEQNLLRRIEADQANRGKVARLGYKQGRHLDHHILNWIGRDVMIIQSTGQCEYYTVDSVELQVDLSLCVRFVPLFTSWDYQGPEVAFELTDHEPLVQISITLTE